jgi:hypothetical protein
MCQQQQEITVTSDLPCIDPEDSSKKVQTEQRNLNQDHGQLPIKSGRWCHHFGIGEKQQQSTSLGSMLVLMVSSKLEEQWQTNNICLEKEIDVLFKSLSTKK